MNKNKKIKEKLVESVKSIFSSDDYKDYLNLMVKLSKINKYSPKNLCLIAAQKPDVTQVCSYTTWKKEFNRIVNKGEKGLMIIVPHKIVMDKEEFLKKYDQEHLPYYVANYKERDDGKIEILSFGTGYVFDVSQTKGDPIPEQNFVNDLDFDVSDFCEYQDALIDISPVPVEFTKLPGEAKGYYSLSEKKIVIQEGMSQAQTFKTMLHEIAHATFEHDISIIDRQTAEVQAESVAYWVSELNGIDTLDYSFAYIATWSKSKEAKELIDSMDVIYNTANEINDKLQKQLEINRSKNVENINNLTNLAKNSPNL